MCITMCITMCILTVSRCVSRCVSSLYHDVYPHCILTVSRCVSLLPGCQVARLPHFGGCIPPQIVVYCVYSHGQPARVDRNNWMYIVSRLSFEAPKQKPSPSPVRAFCYARLPPRLALLLRLPLRLRRLLLRLLHMAFTSSFSVVR